MFNFSHILQVRDSFLRSIVSEPKDFNYVYAPTFASLSQVRKVVLNNTCGEIATLPTSTSQSTTTTPTISTQTPVTPYVNGKYATGSWIFVAVFEFLFRIFVSIFRHVATREHGGSWAQICAPPQKNL